MYNGCIALRPRPVYIRVHDLGGKAPRDTYCQFTIRISTTTKYTLTNTLFFTLRERFVNCFLIGFSPSFTANPNTEINRIKRSDMITFYLSPSPLFECCNTPLMLLVSSCTAAAFLCALWAGLRSSTGSIAPPNTLDACAWMLLATSYPHRPGAVTMALKLAVSEGSTMPARMYDWV